jgi:hypothetical protein
MFAENQYYYISDTSTGKSEGSDDIFFRRKKVMM